MAAPSLFGRGSWPEASRIANVLRTETTGGVLLLAAAVAALGWANSPWGDAYQDLAATRLGPSAWHLDLSLATWAADGLLAICTGSVRDEHAKLGILLGSLIAALLASVLLRMRNRHYRRICAEEEADRDADGVPDVYQRDARA